MLVAKANFSKTKTNQYAFIIMDINTHPRQASLTICLWLVNSLRANLLSANFAVFVAYWHLVGLLLSYM